MKLHVGFDFWGAGNLGDDLMMAGFLTWLEEQAPKVEVSALCAHDLQAMQGRFPSVHWLPSDQKNRELALKEADAWLGLGGSPFQSDLGPWLLNQMCQNMQEAKEQGLPCFLVGVGMNNSEAFQSEEAQQAFSLAERVWLRDESCREAAIAAGHSPNKAQLGADLAHLYGVKLPRAPQNRAAMILHAPKDIICENTLREACHAQPNKQWTWQCQESRSLSDSETLLFEAFSEETRRCFQFSRLDYARCSLEEASSQLCSHGLVLSSRYHGSLAAAWAEARLCIFERNAKLTGLQRELGAQTCTSLHQTGAVSEALSEARIIPRSHLLECRDRASMMLENLFSQLS